MRDLRRLAGSMVPASTEYGVPGADDEAIFADIVRSLGRDRKPSATALAMLREIAGGDFADLDEAAAEAAAMTLLGREGPGDDGARAGRAAMLLPRRPRAAPLGSSSREPPFPTGPRAGTGRLVAAGRGARPAADVARHRRPGRDMTAGEPRHRPTDRRDRRCPDHRLRRFRRRGRLEPGRNADEDPVPRAGRLDEATDFPSNGRDWEARRYARFRHQPQPARRATPTTRSTTTTRR